MDGFDYADDLLSEIEAIERGEERFLREAADAAVRDGKEPFDFEVFRKLYWRQGIMRSGMDSPAAEDAADSYEREYYLGFPQARTIAEFAGMLERLDYELE